MSSQIHSYIDFIFIYFAYLKNKFLYLEKLKKNNNNIFK